MDTKTWIAVAAGFAAIGLTPAFAADARKESIEIPASEKEVEKNKNEAAKETDARAEKAREQDRVDTEKHRRDRRANPNAI
jgi:hypothetical protein